MVICIIALPVFLLLGITNNPATNTGGGGSTVPTYDNSGNNQT